MRVDRKSKVVTKKADEVNALINVEDIENYASADGINPLKLYVYKFKSFPNKLNFTSFSEKFANKYKEYTRKRTDLEDK